MDLPELENLVAPGEATERSVRLWFRSERPGPLRVFVWPAGAQRPALGFPLPHSWQGERDGTGACWYPRECPGAPELAPGCRYQFCIERGDGPRAAELLGSGRFETAPSPDAPRTTFSFALMSCHQPFRADGLVAPEAAEMLAALGPALERQGASYVLSLGDQIYADAPDSASLFAPGGPLSEHPERLPPSARIRAAYQRRYRQAWNTPMGALLAQRPSFLVLDDHDVYDNWGSRPAHQTAPWLAVRAAALEAAFDYQLARNLPEARRGGPYWRWFRWGRTATFLADDRSERWTNEDGSGAILSETQLAGLSAFLEGHRDCGALFIAFSVPLIFLPDWFTSVGVALTGSHAGALDRWSFAGWRRYRDRVFELLLRQRERCPAQQLVLLSGDIHEALAVALRPSDGALPIYQLVSSPVTNTQGGVLQWAAHTASRVTTGIDCQGRKLPVELLPGCGRARRNPYPDLNVGIVEVDAGSSGETARLRFKVLARGAGELAVVFDSGPL